MLGWDGGVVSTPHCIIFSFCNLNEILTGRGVNGFPVHIVWSLQ